MGGSRFFPWNTWYLPLAPENLVLQCENPSLCPTCAYRAQPQLSEVLTVLFGLTDAPWNPGSWAWLFVFARWELFSEPVSHPAAVTSPLSIPSREAGVLPLPPTQVLFLNLRFADFFQFYQRKRKDQILSKGIFPVSNTFKLWGRSYWISA